MAGAADSRRLSGAQVQRAKLAVVENAYFLLGVSKLVLAMLKQRDPPPIGR
jgi:hypothetical protein